MLLSLELSTRLGRVLAIFAILTWAATFFGVLVWMVIGQREYLHLYRVVHRLTPSELPLSDEFSAEQMRQFPLGTAHILEDRLEAMLTAQADPNLEYLRQRMLWRFGIAVACGVGSIILFVIISS